MKTVTAMLLVLASLPLHAQTSWFSERQLKQPQVQKAFASLDEPAIVDEWIRLTEVPSPSGKEQARADYVRAELQKLGLTDIRTDEMLNVSGVRKGTGKGPSVAFVAHLDTVFPAATDVKVRRDGGLLRAPGIGDDTGNVVALLEAFRALNRAGIQTKGDLIFVASTQEEVGLKGAKYWLTHTQTRPDMFVALDVESNAVWYGALRIDLMKFYFSAPAVHTLRSRGTPSPAKAVVRAIEAVYAIPLPPLASDVGEARLPVINVGMLGGGSVANAIPAETWFTVDLRSLDTATQDRLRTAVTEAARRAAEDEHVSFRVENTLVTEDYSKSLPKEQRLAHPLVKTAVDAANYFRKPGSPAVVPLDLGSTDANIAISLGIPAIATGTLISKNPHQLEENAEAASIVPGIKQLISLTLALTTH
jgi:acetylornithine deacetylase/succinyl-diaminopimelate desuccinylase-like protein